MSVWGVSDKNSVINSLQVLPNKANKILGLLRDYSSDKKTFKIPKNANHESFGESLLPEANNNQDSREEEIAVDCVLC